MSDTKATWVPPIKIAIYFLRIAFPTWILHCPLFWQQPT